jgi:Trypsin
MRLAKESPTLAALLAVGLALGSCSAAPSDEPVGQTSEPIVNGVNSDASQNFAVLIVHPTGGQYYECTGTLVAPNLVLTARHCVSSVPETGFSCTASGVGSSGGAIGADFDPSTLLVFTGGARPLDLSNPAAVGMQTFHDSATNLCNHDVALIGLSQSMPSGIPIAAMRFVPLPSVGELVTAVGWGVTTVTELPSVRQQRSGVSIVETGPFTDTGGDDVAPSEFDVGEAICEGDSGGPALDGSSAVIGVASRGGNEMKPQTGDLSASCVGGQTLNYYSKVGAFSSVILHAFDAMGATPTIVTGPAPPSSGSGGCDVAPLVRPSAGVSGLLAAIGLALTRMRRRARAARRRRVDLLEN